MVFIIGTFAMENIADLSLEPDSDFLYSNSTYLPFANVLTEVDPQTLAASTASDTLIEPIAPDASHQVPLPSSNSHKQRPLKKKKAPKAPKPPVQVNPDLPRNVDVVFRLQSGTTYAFSLRFGFSHIILETRFGRWIRVVVNPACSAIRSHLIVPISSLMSRVPHIVTPVAQQVYSVAEILATYTAQVWKLYVRSVNALITDPAIVVLRFAWQVVQHTFSALFVSFPRWIVATFFTRGVHQHSYCLDVVPAKDLRNGYFSLHDGQTYEIYLANHSNTYTYVVLESKLGGSR